MYGVRCWLKVPCAVCGFFVCLIFFSEHSATLTKRLFMLVNDSKLVCGRNRKINGSCHFLSRCSLAAVLLFSRVCPPLSHADYTSSARCRCKCLHEHILSYCPSPAPHVRRLFCGRPACEPTDQLLCAPARVHTNAGIDLPSQYDDEQHHLQLVYILSHCEIAENSA